MYNLNLLNAIKNNNYVDNYPDETQQCKNCVYFGEFYGHPYWLCAKKTFDIQEISACGHCDAFSNDKKINLLKYGMLKLMRYEFQNKVR